MSGPRKVLITGAHGFIGAALSRRYRDLGVEVVGIDLTGDPENNVRVGDVRKPEPWEVHLDGVDLVVHAAAIVTLEGDADEFWSVNVLGTRQVVDAAVRHGVKRLVHLSSVTVFGWDFPDGVDETWPVHPNGTPYVDTKIAAEQVVLEAHAAGDIDAVIIRPGDVFGPWSHPWTLTPIEYIRSGRMILPNKGEGIISPIYIDNLIDALVAAGEKEQAAGQVITVTNGVGIRARSFFRRYCDLMRVGPPRTAPYRLLRPAVGVVGFIDRLRGQPGHFEPATIDYMMRKGTYSIERAQQILDFEPRIDLDEGFKLTAQWLVKEGII
ncbi:MAG: NAD-dependent epimerase/dehydratase family protein [Nitriliruptorales bacterium]|nr:NAD-dependent epimerase/dehydratase family protein [Nitriliruptorales bacterium]